MSGHRIFATSFASIHPHDVHKAEGGRTGAGTRWEQVISWLTGYDAAGLVKAIADEVDLETFFAAAPRMNLHADDDANAVGEPASP